MKKVHFIGVGGTGMLSCAGLFKEMGYEVKGSDQKLYPPASDMIEKIGIERFEGYSPENLNWDPDLVVVGNICRPDHVEAVAAKESRAETLSFPQSLEKYLFPERKPLVVAGTHGKTTTTSMLAHCLEALGENPGYLIGGQALNFENSFCAGKKASFFLIEGDEYDSAYFDKIAKFLHYSPHGILITSVEWDHVDIYPSEENYFAAFNKLIKDAPKGPIIICKDGPGTSKIGPFGKKPVYYGKSTENDYSFKHKGSELSFFKVNEKYQIKAPWIGAHNSMNACGVFALLCELGIDAERAAKSFESFKGVRRRQEIFHEFENIKFYDDFAHHPEAIKVTLDAFLESKDDDEELWCVFEPRSNTSQTKLFQDAYPKAFKDSDYTIMAKLGRAGKLDPKNLLDRDLVIKTLKSKGKKAEAIDNSDEIVAHLKENLKSKARVVIMSNGAFDGIYSKIKKAF